MIPSQNDVENMVKFGVFRLSWAT